MKKNYEMPEIEFIQLNILDIIAISTQGTEDQAVCNGGNED